MGPAAINMVVFIIVVILCKAIIQAIIEKIRKSKHTTKKFSITNDKDLNP